MPLLPAHSLRPYLGRDWKQESRWGKSQSWGIRFRTSTHNHPPCCLFCAFCLWGTWDNARHVAIKGRGGRAKKRTVEDKGKREAGRKDERERQMLQRVFNLVESPLHLSSKCHNRKYLRSDVLGLILKNTWFSDLSGCTLLPVGQRKGARWLATESKLPFLSESPFHLIPPHPWSQSTAPQSCPLWSLASGASSSLILLVDHPMLQRETVGPGKFRRPQDHPQVQ